MLSDRQTTRPHHAIMPSSWLAPECKGNLWTSAYLYHCLDFWSTVLSCYGNWLVGVHSDAAHALVYAWHTTCNKGLTTLMTALLPVFVQVCSAASSYDVVQHPAPYIPRQPPATPFTASAPCWSTWRLLPASDFLSSAHLIARQGAPADRRVRCVIAVWAAIWKRCQAPMAAHCAAAGRLAVQQPVRCLLTLFLAGLVFSMLVSALHLTAARYSVLTLHPSGGLEVLGNCLGYTVGRGVLSMLDAGLRRLRRCKPAAQRLHRAVCSACHGRRPPDVACSGW